MLLLFNAVCHDLTLIMDNNIGWILWSIFHIFEIICFVVAVFDLVHNVEAIHVLC